MLSCPRGELARVGLFDVENRRDALSADCRHARPHRRRSRRTSNQLQLRRPVQLKKFDIPTLVTLDQFWLWSMQAGKQTSLMASDAGALAQPLGRPVQDSETR
jgi:hypothetical protein